jgi:hypothetical protein
MLRNVKDIEGFAIGATDGVVGHVRDVYFDDEAWVIRYFVVETALRHGNRRVLISPFALGQPNWSEKTVPAAITQAQVENSPDVDTDKPVSRQHEMGYLSYYGYPNYWGGGGLWGAGVYPDILQAGLDPISVNNANIRERSARGGPKSATKPNPRPTDTHLRSANDVMRYYVQASDGDIGHVQGLLVEDRTWAVRYFIVNTSNWWLGHAVLISPEWIDDVYWAESKLVVSISRQAVKDSPSYDPSAVLDRTQEEALHVHYGHAGYWPLEASSSEAGHEGGDPEYCHGSVDWQDQAGGTPNVGNRRQ